ncbi:MAG: B12-binding domain-containing radical SAM protein, partial [Alphaproteobacteria bacterium]
MRIGLAYLGRENIELEYLSAVLKGAEHEVLFLYDPGAYTANDNVLHSPWLAKRFSRTPWLVRQAAADPPDLLFFHAESITLGWALDLARQIRKQTDIPVVFGGRHPTFAPHAVMKHEVVDYVVVGEAEETLPELAAAIADGKNPATVRGIHFRENGQTLSTGTRPPVDLDKLPWPDKELFAAEWNMADDYLLLVGRGCPGQCTYCQEAVLKKLYGPQYFRRRARESVLAELEERKRRYNFAKVMIDDPIFFTSKKWVLEFLAEYKKRIGAPFRCYGQLKWLDEELARALQEAGCYGVEFGYQTYSDAIRRDTLDRPETNVDA